MSDILVGSIEHDMLDNLEKSNLYVNHKSVTINGVA